MGQYLDGMLCSSTALWCSLEEGKPRAPLGQTQAWQVPKRIPAAQKPLVQALRQLLGKDHLTPKHVSTLGVCRAKVLIELALMPMEIYHAVNEDSQVCAERAQKCPFGLLLEHHCPLPPGMPSTQHRQPCTEQPPSQQPSCHSSR